MSNRTGIVLLVLVAALVALRAAGGLSALGLAVDLPPSMAWAEIEPLQFGWMAWTRTTAIFFAAIAGLIALMGVWEAVAPGGGPRHGILGIETTRGDRLFLALLSAAFIHLGVLGLTDWPLWYGLVISAGWGALLFAVV